MRFIIPDSPRPDSFSDNVAFTLRAMGHEVLLPPADPGIIDYRFRHMAEVALDRIAPNMPTKQERWLLGNYRRFRADAMISLTQSVSEDALLQLQRDGVYTISWWGDTAANMRKQGLLTYGWDRIYIKDKYAVFKLRTLGLPAEYLPEAMNPEWHKPLYMSVGEDVVFAGNAYNYRHFLLRQMLRAGIENIKLYGGKPPRWSSSEVRSLYVGRSIVKEEKSRVFGEALTCINSTAMSEGNSMNCRAFELAGAGALQIMEYRPAIADCFEPEREIVTYSSIGELKEKIDFFRAHPDEAQEIRKAAYKRAINEHTYQHRIQFMIDEMRR